MIVTIDGPAGTGKTTVAKLLADRLGIVYFDTGALYRAFTWFYFAHEKNSSIEAKAISDALKHFDLKIEPQAKSGWSYKVAGSDITGAIRTLAVTDKVSAIAAEKSVRAALIPFQRAFAKEHGVVVEGRDTGSVIFPQAEHKFFLTASLKVRAQRRFAEYRAKGEACSLQEVEQNIAMRDKIDSSRKQAPLVCPENAHVIETDDKSAQQVTDVIYQLIMEA